MKKQNLLFISLFIFLTFICMDNVKAWKACQYQYRSNHQSENIDLSFILSKERPDITFSYGSTKDDEDEISNWYPNELIDGTQTIGDLYFQNNECPKYILFVRYFDDSGIDHDVDEFFISHTDDLDKIKKYIEDKYTTKYPDFPIVIQYSGEETNEEEDEPDDPIIYTSCLDFKDEKTCTQNEYFSCLWNKKDGYCNSDSLQFVTCGKAHDIPPRIPAIVSFGVTLLKVMAPIILIIVSVITLLKAMISSNQDSIKAAQKKLINKVIAAVLVFFIISIVQFVVGKVAEDSDVGNISSCLRCFLNNDCGGNKYYKTNSMGIYYCVNLETKEAKTCDEYYKGK